MLYELKFVINSIRKKSWLNHVKENRNLGEDVLHYYISIKSVEVEDVTTRNIIVLMLCKKRMEGAGIVMQ
jgi:hypothetical protein